MMMKKKFFILLFVSVLIILFILFIPKEKTATATEFYMDTVIHMTVTGENPDALLDMCRETFEHYDRLWSKTSESGDVYKINHSGGQWVEVSGETIGLLREALYYHEISNGRFCITIGALSALWDYKKHTVPEKALIQKAMATVGDHQILIQDQKVKLQTEETQLDLGAIAKGRITDIVVQKLRENGCKSALLDVGGNVYALGQKKNSKLWRIGVRDPLDESGSYFAVLAAKDMAIVSSGDYERSFSDNKRWYHHIIDPQSGYPAETDLTQTTIIHQNACDADALSTIVFMLGMEDGKTFLNENHLSGILVSKKGETVYVNCESYMEDM